MKKLLLLLVIFLLVGCANDKFYLSDKYYNNGDLININSTSINEDESFILYTYNNFCNLPVSCETIFKEVTSKYKLDVLSIPFEEFKKTEYYGKVKYAPSVLLINKGKIISYLDANSDRDYEKYQDSNKFEEWLSKYIYLEKATN